MATRAAALEQWKTLDAADVAAWSGPLNLRPKFPPAILPGTLRVVFADPGAMFDANAGYVFEGDALVHMGATEGTPVLSLSAWRPHHATPVPSSLLSSRFT
jgi:hypothetical protein